MFTRDGDGYRVRKWPGNGRSVDNKEFCNEPNPKAREVLRNQKRRTLFFSCAVSDSVIAVVLVQSVNVVSEL